MQLMRIYAKSLVSAKNKVRNAGWHIDDNNCVVLERATPTEFGIYEIAVTDTDTASSDVFNSAEEINRQTSNETQF